MSNFNLLCETHKVMHILMFVKYVISEEIYVRCIIYTTYMYDIYACDMLINY